MSNTNQNPLLMKSQLPDGAVPFDQIRVEHFLPAIDESIKLGEANIAAIKNSTDEPSFENTIEALETATEQLDYASGVYFNLFSAHADEELQALAKEISPRLAKFSSDVSLDEKIFERVDKVYQLREKLNLNQEQMQLLDKTYKSFVRNGAKLANDKKEELRQIDQELSLLGPKFSENVLKATNSFELLLDESDLDGLPEGYKEAAAEAAKEKGHDGKWLVNLDFPSYFPFLKFSARRDLRQKVWKAYSSRAVEGEFDNREIVQKIVDLRHKRAKILGFNTHADFVLEERMAEAPQKVFDFLNTLLEPSKKAAQEELNELKAFKKKLDGSDDIKPWDLGYYSEKLKEEKFQFSEEELKPYFPLEQVIDGVFEHARKLYGIKFKPRTDLPTYHPEVKVFEVSDEKTSDYVGLFYADFFPRPTKRGGAWMTEFRGQGLREGEIRRPHVAIVCNFTKPTATKPSLLTLMEVETLFHEFGHALHGLLSDVKYPSLAGPNVYWDFVELPSQLMENWVHEKEGLDLFAKHYQTGETIPAELVEKIKKLSQFHAGIASTRQLDFALLDMAWHGQTPPEALDVIQFEREATLNTAILPPEEGVNKSVSFSHIFAGGYSAGYYSYKWAEVLDADAFELFKEKGIFNTEVSRSFRENILSRGGTEHPMTLYKRFRGREPDPKALLRREGLI